MTGMRRTWVWMLLPLLFVLGCRAFPEQQLSDDFPAFLLSRLDLQPEVRLGFGPLALMPARLVAVFWPSTGELRAAARGVRKVEVGVFKFRSGGIRARDMLWAGLGQRLQEKGWQLLTRVREVQECTWVYYLPGRHDIRQMYVINLDLAGGELVLVKIYGRLDRAIRAVLQQTRRGRG